MATWLCCLLDKNIHWLSASVKKHFQETVLGKLDALLYLFILLSPPLRSCPPLSVLCPPFYFHHTHTHPVVSATAMATTTTTILSSESPGNLLQFPVHPQGSGPSRAGGNQRV